MTKGAGQLLREAAEVYHPIRDFCLHNKRLIMSAALTDNPNREAILKLIAKREQLDAEIIALVSGLPEKPILQAS